MDKANVKGTSQKPQPDTVWITELRTHFCVGRYADIVPMVIPFRGYINFVLIIDFLEDFLLLVHQGSVDKDAPSGELFKQ